MKRGTAWPVAVGAILGTCVAANIWLIRLASTDPSFAIEEDYYQRALHWDDELAQRRQNDALGWQLAPTLSAVSADSGAELRLTLRDAAGKPLEGAAVTVRALHNARAGEPLDAELAPRGTADFAARLPMRRPGLWELRFEVRRGTDRFTARQRVDARAAAP
jgi:nitrogen fixation protein FixH